MEPVELVRSDLRGIWLLLAPAIVVGTVVALLGNRMAIAVSSAVIVGGILALIVLSIRRRVGRNAIFGDDKSLIVVTRGRARRSYRWEQLRGASWEGGSFWTAWEPGGVKVTRDGGSPGEPGLVKPERVGSVVIVRPWKRAAAGDRLDAFIAARLSGTTDAAAEPTPHADAAPEVRPRHDAHPWWHGVLYHVYLRSFADSDGDGVGDIPGLMSRLDHLAWLGVDGIWVSPVMSSPNDDWGYDIADYTAVDGTYGTLEDVDKLIAEAAARGMRVLFDLVPNHSSDRHPWFVASRSSRNDPKRNWYVWADPRPDGSPPNNWVSNFFGPAWTLDEGTGQYYLHSFLPSQPDLNWWNPDVRVAIEDALRFWFDRGVAGFRIDVVHKLAKDPALRDNPPATEGDTWIEQAWGQKELHTANLPETHEIIRRWRRVADSYPEPPVLLGETYVLDLGTMASYHGDGDELHLSFNIPFLHAPFEAKRLRDVIAATALALPESAWPVWNGSSHDISRMATRWGAGDARKIRCALMLLLTMRGAPLLYYGDEIGMPDVAVPPERSLDPLGKRIPGTVSAGRDPARTPMQWAAGSGAAFTDPGVEPWLPLGDAARCNVEDQRADRRSVLWLCRDLIALRREWPDLQAGRLELIDAPEGVLAWRRGDRVSVVLNLRDDPAFLGAGGARILAGTRRDREGERVRGTWSLAPWEGVVLYE